MPGHLTPAQFCQAMTNFSESCVRKLLGKRLQKPAKGPGAQRRTTFYKMLLKRFATQRHVMTKRCVVGFAREQKRRRAAKKAPISGTQLAACFMCMRRVGCRKQRQCRAICVR